MRAPGGGRSVAGRRGGATAGRVRRVLLGGVRGRRRAGRVAARGQRRDVRADGVRGLPRPPDPVPRRGRSALHRRRGGRDLRLRPREGHRRRDRRHRARREPGLRPAGRPLGRVPGRVGGRLIQRRRERRRRHVHRPDARLADPAGRRPEHPLAAHPSRRHRGETHPGPSCGVTATMSRTRCASVPASSSVRAGRRRADLPRQARDRAGRHGRARGVLPAADRQHAGAGQGLLGAADLHVQRPPTAPAGRGRAGEAARRQPACHRLRRPRGRPARRPNRLLPGAVDRWPAAARTPGARGLRRF